MYPDHPDLLRALAAFLRDDIRAALSGENQRGLRFRALVAAHVADRLAAEVDADEALLAGEAEALADLLARTGASPVAPAGPGSRARRRAQLTELRARLAARIRDETLDDARRAELRAGLLATMRARLAVQSPRFVLDRDIE